ncbi:MAG: Amidohydrolase, partial [uncultured Thermomicrobiales bacterium]
GGARHRHPGWTRHRPGIWALRGDRRRGGRREDRGGRGGHRRGVGRRGDRRGRTVRDAGTDRSPHARLLGRNVLGDRARPDRRPKRGDHLARRRKRRRIHLARVPAVRGGAVQGPGAGAAQPVEHRARGADLGALQPRLLRPRARPADDRGEPRPDRRDQGPDRPQHDPRRRHPAAGARAG